MYLTMLTINAGIIFLRDDVVQSTERQQAQNQQFIHEVASITGLWQSCMCSHHDVPDRITTVPAWYQLQQDMDKPI